MITKEDVKWRNDSDILRLTGWQKGHQHRKSMHEEKGLSERERELPG